MQRTALLAPLFIVVTGSNASAEGDDWDVDFGDDDGVAAAILEKSAAELDGDVSTESFVYPEGDDGGPARHSVDVRLRAEAQRQSTTVRAALLIRKDLADSERDRFEADEAYVDVGKGKTRLRIGRSHASWGAATLFNPADLITPVDLTDFVEAEDRPAFMVWARTRLGPIGVDAYLLPVPEASDVPLLTDIGADGQLIGNNRWLRGRLPTEMGGVPVQYTLAPAEERTAAIGDTGGAVRLSVAAAGADFALGYGSFIARVPHFEENVSPSEDGMVVELRPVFDREHIVTFEAARPFGRARFALEAAVTAPEGEREAYASGVLSFDYNSAEFRGDHSINVVVEAATTQPLGDAELPMDPMSRLRYRFAAAVLARIEYRAGTQWRARVVGIQNLDTLGIGRLPARDGGHHDFLVYPEIETQVMGNVSAAAGFMLLRGAPGSLFGGYEDNSRFTLSLSAAL